MPQTINGIGTWYYGKRELHTHFGQCEHCGKPGELESYDTTKYFVVFFLPLIPLQKLRVVNRCPRCSRHAAVPKAKWDELARTSITEAVELLRQKPTEEDSARQAMVAVVQFQDRKAFGRVAPLIEGSFSHHPDILAELASVHEFFGDTAGAERCYRASLAISDDPDTRAAFALLCIREDRPAEARPLLQHVIDEPTPETVDLLYALVEGYQAVGEHQDALDLLKAIAATVPEAAGNKQHSRYQRVSQKHLASRKRIGAKRGASREARERSASRRAVAMRALAVGVVLALFGAYFFRTYQAGHSRTVWLVNGLPVPYVVVVNGIEHRLPAGGHRRITIAEGTVEVKPSGDGPAVPAASCTIRTPFFSRVFLDRTFVINPDRNALLLWQETVYSEKPDPKYQAPFTIYTGEPMYEFKSIDYEFGVFPDEISISSGSRATRQRIAHLNDMSPAAAVAMIANYLGEDKATTFVRARLSYDPDNMVLLAMLGHLMAPEKLLEVLRPELEHRPVRVEWHRLYQETMDRLGRHDALTAEYSALLRTRPTDPQLLYLTARLIDDPKAARARFEQAAAAKPPSAYAIGALAFDELVQGNFDTALRRSDEALALRPGHYLFSFTRNQALLALERYDTLLEASQRSRKAAPDDRDAVGEEIWLHLCRGEEQLARQLADRFCLRLKQQGADPDYTNDSRHYFDALLQYAAGNGAAFSAARRQMLDDRAAFEATVAAREWANALEALTAIDQPKATDHLLLYLAAMKDGRTKDTAPALDAATVLLAEGSSVERRVATWLKGTETPSWEQLQSLALRPAEKRLALACLGLIHPDLKARCRRLAKRLNYNRQFPYLLVREILD